MVKTIVPVLEMSCASCAVSVESIVQSLDGVQRATVNFASGNLDLEYDPEKVTLEEIRSRVQSIGYDLIIESENRVEKQEKAAADSYRSLFHRVLWAWGLSIPLMVLSMFFMHNTALNWVMFFLTLPILIYCGKSFYVTAWKQMKKGNANMDTLVALSTSIAFLFSFFNTVYPAFWTSRSMDAHVYYEAAGMIISFVLLGKLFEQRAKKSTTSALKALMGLQPKSARKITEDGEVEVPIASLKIGDQVRVIPGEKISVDGIIVSGSSYVDQSMITGEAIAVEKTVDDKVLAGTINQKGAFVIRATGVGGQTVLAQIVRMVEEAQGSKAPVQKIVDRVSSIFVPIVIGLSILTFIVWLLFGGVGYFSYALLAAVSVLVIACPCALGLATPTALMVGIGKAAEKHILIKDAYALEMMCKVNCVVLDKTGTVTEGRPSVVDCVWEEENPSYRSILKSIEMRSEHPLAGAIVQYFKQEASVELASFNSLTGRGVEALFDGASYWVGSRALATEKGTKFEFSSWEKRGATLIFFGRDNQLIATLALADRVKPTSAEAIQQLTSKGIEVHLLTGDSAATAEAVALEVGIKNVKAEVMPQDKEDYIAMLQSEGKVVAMVGDGINDSQALARADVSIAMGRGTDIAMDVAMVTLVTSDLSLLSTAASLSKRTVRLIHENLFWAFVYNLIGIPIAAGVLFPVFGLMLNPMWASAAMAFSSVSVVLNSLRLKLRK